MKSSSDLSHQKQNIIKLDLHRVISQSEIRQYEHRERILRFLINILYQECTTPHSFQSNHQSTTSIQGSTRIQSTTNIQSATHVYHQHTSNHP